MNLTLYLFGRVNYFSKSPHRKGAFDAQRACSIPSCWFLGPATTTSHVIFLNYGSKFSAAPAWKIRSNIRWVHIAVQPGTSTVNQIQPTLKSVNLGRSVEGGLRTLYSPPEACCQFPRRRRVRELWRSEDGRSSTTCRVHAPQSRPGA